MSSDVGAAHAANAGKDVHADLHDRPGEISGEEEGSAVVAAATKQWDRGVTSFAGATQQ